MHASILTRTRIAATLAAFAAGTVLSAAPASAQDQLSDPAQQPDQETPAPGSLPAVPFSQLLAPLAVQKTITFGSNPEVSEYLCHKWARLAPGWQMWDISDCYQDDNGVWTATYKQWPDWISAPPFTSASVESLLPQQSN